MAKISYGFRFPLHLACDTIHELLPDLGRVYFEDGYAYATVRLILVKFKISDLFEGKGDAALLDKKTLPVASFRALYQTREEPEIKADGIQLGEVLYKTREEAKAPLNFERALEYVNGAPEAVEKIAFNPEKIHKLGQIMADGNGLRFEFYGNRRGAVVKPTSPELHAMALLMPLAL